MMRRTLVLAFALAVTAGCTSASHGAGSAPRSSSNLLTRQEIAESPYQNAYEVVEKLRPAFLRARTTSSGPGYTPVVYVDGLRKGGTEQLRAIPTREVVEI